MNKTICILLIPFFSFIPFKVTDTAAQQLPFSQNWSNTGLIISDNNWTAVPGIEGFNGNGLTFGTGTDPQTIVGTGVFATPVVIANQSDPNNLITGGVAEFDGIANPSIALQPNASNSANAPYILISLNTTNRQNVNVSYNLRDLDGSADNAIQPVALQYRAGNTGNFTNVPAGFVTDATTGPNLATLVTAVSAVLPNAVNNLSLVQVRIITADAVGNDEWVGVDDINITGTVINPVPVVTTTPGTTTYIYNTPVVIDNGLTVADANNTTLPSATVSITNGFQSATDALLFTGNAGTMGNITGSYSQFSGILTLNSASATATLAQWQEALRSIRFSASGVPANHNVTINFTVNDGLSNSIAATKPVAVYQSPPPIVSTSAGNTTYVHSTPAIVDNGITVTDANNTTLASATVSLTGSFQSGTDILGFTNNGTTMGNITGNYATPLGILNLTSAGATATLAQWQAALRSVSFYSTLNPQVYNRTVSFVANDGANNSMAASKIIVVQPGLPPVVTATAGSTTYIHGTPVIVDNGITVSDNDSPTLPSASISFSSGFEIGNDYITFTNDNSTMGNISGSYSQPLGILNLSSAGATATLAQWQAALRSVIYYNADTVPQTQNRVISFTVNDGVATSNAANKIITFMPLSSISQTWSPAVQVIDPNFGVDGNVGQHTKMFVVNGNPAIVYYDATRTNLIYRRATDVLGSAFGRGITLDSLGDVGQYLSVAVVNGNPAIAYYDATNQDLKYIRALDVDGNAWGSPISIDTTRNVGIFTSLQVINGNPAIAYNDVTFSKLKYIRSSDSNGSTWNTPIIVDPGNSRGWYASMEIVNGNPAIAYYDFGVSYLRFIRATDVSGTGWGTSVIIDQSNAVGEYVSLKVINGNPAVSYYENFYGFNSPGKNLRYARAYDASGTSWSGGVLIDELNDVGRYTSLQLVNGNPAISYSDVTYSGLKYVRATDAIGITWGAPVKVDQSYGIIQYTTLLVISGNPSISYYDYDRGNVKYVRASEANGTTWPLPVSIDSWGQVGVSPSVKMVNGNPAFAFANRSNGDLQYVRASNTTGSAWNLPVTVDATSNIKQSLSMAIVNGNPAIAYYDTTMGNLKYVQAADALGTIWNAPIIVDNIYGSGHGCTLIIVNGIPAISYYNAAKDLKYVRAANVAGSAWNTPLTLGGGGGVNFTCMQIINGNPAIAYVTNGSLMYIRANDISGLTWSTQVMAAEGFNNSTPSLQTINGNPAVAYYNGNLKYVRSSDASGIAWPSSIIADAAGNTGHFPILQVVNNLPAIVYNDINSNNNNVGVRKYVSATNISGSSWGIPVILDPTLNTSASHSFITSGNFMGLAYYHESQALPYFFPGHFGFSSLSSHYFRSKQNGNWNDINSWESSPDNANWGQATLTPDFTANTIIIKNGHTINVTANVTVDQLVLEPGSVLITNTGINLIIK